MVNGVNAKNPALAALGSFFIPGMGQVYNGQGYLKGLFYLIGTLIGYVFLIVPGVIFWLYGVYNAYSVAKKVNAGALPYRKVGVSSLLIYAVIGWVVIFVGIVVLTFALFAVIMALVVFLSGGQ